MNPPESFLYRIENVRVLKPNAFCTEKTGRFRRPEFRAGDLDFVKSHF